MEKFVGDSDEAIAIIKQMERAASSDEPPFVDTKAEPVSNVMKLAVNSSEVAK